MRVDTDRHCETNVAAKTLSIAANAKMFRILSSGLYTQKEEAVVRELLCNAYDAHTKAGTTDVPIKVQLPTALDPHFIIEDYGTGLSLEGIDLLYTTYGGSDKADSDELIGGFGLGSKSPLCITDQFTVESRYNGERHLIQVFIQADGTPGYALLSTTPTNEPNGMTVRVPVPGDFQRWTNALHRLAIFAPMPLEVAGHEIPEMERVLYEVDTPDHEHVERVVITQGQTTFAPNRAAIHELIVVQGHVPYTVDTSPIAASYIAENVFYQLMRSTNLNVYVYTKIGAFPLAVSRETFEDTPVTRERLLDLTSELLPRVVGKFVEEAVSGIRTWWDFAELAGDFNLQVKARDIPALHALADIDDWGLQNGRNIPVSMISSDPLATYCHLFYSRRSGETRMTTTTPNTLPGPHGHGGGGRPAKDRAFYVLPKGKPFRKAAEEILRDPSTAVDGIYILRGDKEAIQTELDALGTPYKVQDLPIIKPVRGTSARRLPSGKYVTSILRRNAPAGTFRTDEITLDTVANMMAEENQPQLVITNLKAHYYEARAIQTNLQKRYVDVPTDTVILLHIPERANRIRARVVKMFGPDRAHEGIEAFNTRFSTRRTWIARALLMLYHSPEDDPFKRMNSDGYQHLPVLTQALLELTGRSTHMATIWRRYERAYRMTRAIITHSDGAVPPPPQTPEAEKEYQEVYDWLKERLSTLGDAAHAPVQQLHDEFPELEGIEYALRINRRDQETAQRLANILSTLIQGDQIREAA